MIVETLPVPGVWRRARPMAWTMSAVLVLGSANRMESMAGMSTPSAHTRQLVSTARCGRGLAVVAVDGDGGEVVEVLLAFEGALTAVDGAHRQLARGVFAQGGGGFGQGVGEQGGAGDAGVEGQGAAQVIGAHGVEQGDLCNRGAQSLGFGRGCGAAAKDGSQLVVVDERGRSTMSKPTR
jgi:hypothetical protein